jgi:hypothetical protein
MIRCHDLLARLAVLSTSAFALSAAGCAAAGAAQSEDLAAYGDDSIETESNLESVGQSFVGSTNGRVGIQSAASLTATAPHAGIQVADIVSDPAGGFFEPAGCLVEDQSPATESATYTFTDCSGPHGLLHLTGVVHATWSSASSDAISIVLSASDFKVNDATVTSWSANATVTADGDSRSMAWSAKLSGTTGAGRAFVRSNDKTIGWTVGGSCLSISGTSTGTISGLDLQTTLTSYSRCEGTCPAAGSNVRIEDVTTGASIDLQYLGGAQAAFTGLRGATTDITLACTP